MPQTTLSEVHTERNSGLQVFQPADQKYFDHLSRCIGKSGRFEVADFVGAEDPFEKSEGFFRKRALELGKISITEGSEYRIASFYAHPGELIPSSCVLRQSSWRSEEQAFQRLIDLERITAMRKYHADGGEVFPTNLIVAIKGGAVKDGDDGFSQVEIPHARESISVIDGQHRLFAYSDIHDDFNKKITALKGEQELLVTAYIFNEDASDALQTKVQAQLFLDINSKQKKVPASIRQVINRMCNPLSDEGIAASVMQDLLSGSIFRCDRSQISTSAIVSYSIIPLIKFSNSRPNSLSSQWKRAHGIIGNGSDEDRLKYQEYLKEIIRTYFSSWARMVERLGQLRTDLKQSKALTGSGIGGVFYSIKNIVEGSPDGLVTRIEAWGERAFDGVSFSYHPSDFTFSSNGRIAHGAALSDAVINVRQTEA